MQIGIAGSGSIRADALEEEAAIGPESALVPDTTSATAHRMAA
jgi:hypothetical protein